MSSEGEIGIGNGDALLATRIGHVGEVIHGEVIVTRMSVRIVAAVGLALVQVDRADFFAACRGVVQREGKGPVAHVLKVRSKFVADVDAVGITIECDGRRVRESGIAAGADGHGNRAAVFDAQRLTSV